MADYKLPDYLQPDKSNINPHLNRMVGAGIAWTNDEDARGSLGIMDGLYRTYKKHIDAAGDEEAQMRELFNLYNAYEGNTSDFTFSDGTHISEDELYDAGIGYSRKYGNPDAIDVQDFADFIDRGTLFNVIKTGYENSDDYKQTQEYKDRVAEQTTDTGYSDLGRKDYSDLSNNSAREAALDAYYRDAMDYKTQGTFANDSYNRFVEGAQNEALEAGRLADISAQQQALQQAATIKGISDQVKQERMARLRAGMSESQIASQDMQNMMMNMQAVNQAANDANMARAQAQSAYGTAQDQAYQNWLQQANAQATVGATYSAANAGDVIQQAKKLKRNQSLTPYVNTVAGYNQNKNS